MKDLKWIDSSRKDLREFPDEIKEIALIESRLKDAKSLYKQLKF